MNPKNWYITRDIETPIEKNLGNGKIIILYGARRTGKTTLAKKLFEKRGKPYLYLSCEQQRIQEQLVPDSLRLKEVVGSYKHLVFDEAQYLDNPGLVLKVLIDTFPNLSIIASGSSSFELAGKVSEPLTGRHLTYYLFPLSWHELAQDSSPLDYSFMFEQILRFGSYPEVVASGASDKKVQYLQLLAEDYLYKDILAFQRIKDSRKLRELLVAIALQIGQEVSYSELANTLSVDRKTVEHFLDLLEKTFVIFRLWAFSRNLRSEINRKVKIYFYDLGIRNTLINNFNPPDIRADKGALFENYAISEMVKRNSNRAHRSSLYFWRTYDQKEIDLIEERAGRLTGFEFKYSDKVRQPKAAIVSFQKAYPGSTITTVSPKTLPRLLENKVAGSNVEPGEEKDRG